ncbi:receptor-interacting serine/threonine-protein kinase 3-like isoform X2 [Denticeps clupeoides]|uniref:receptor-interacting serine/threonine-protein kinase 3-like isoform X2 n=1 Tax=Denticeps clupeoides TaxID=299321 RepID=UPI0010A4A0A5|nr:receptor-interacting serine/threonine-protein kinase 3-like isoform X2 [Denticeps clupeoides]
MELAATLGTVCDSSLTDWKVIGGGGFGQIFRARHEDWKLDVAVKLLRNSDGAALLKEANLMQQGGSPCVLRIMGVYRGRPPQSVSDQLGLVMPFMERGSLASLQKALCGPPPSPLAFRLAHQVALGMNFLHCLSPPLLHLDLKPSNVLLDNDLNAKLSDFGLSKFSRSSITAVSDQGSGAPGTLPYMPPEAFQLSHKPSCASDVYSYGILLWSLFSGQEPYPDAISSMVKFHVPNGQRPDLKELGSAQEAELIGLITNCWATEISARPSFKDCLCVTEDLWEKHEENIFEAVYHVQKRLKSTGVDSTKKSNNAPSHAVPQASGYSSHVTTRTFPQQESGKAAVSKETNHSRAYKAPGLTSYPFPYQRQNSTPSSPRRPEAGMYLSNVNGVQIGNHNYMFIQRNSGKKRHPTAPPRLSSSESHPRPKKM